MLITEWLNDRPEITGILIKRNGYTITIKPIDNDNSYPLGALLHSNEIAEGVVLVATMEVDGMLYNSRDLNGLNHHEMVLIPSLKVGVFNERVMYIRFDDWQYRQGGEKRTYVSRVNAYQIHERF